MSENKQELFEKLSPEMLESVSGGELSERSKKQYYNYVYKCKQRGDSLESVIKYLANGRVPEVGEYEGIDYVREIWETVDVDPMW